MPRGRHAHLRLLRCSATGAAALTMAGCGSSEPPLKRAHAASAASTGGCTTVAAPTPRAEEQVPRPNMTLDPAKRYVVHLSTNCGTIDIQLAVGQAPRTTASFAYLVQRGFYNGLTFHRVAADFVIQGGDPDGDGSGGPGYTVVEPPPEHLRYTIGTVAMAKKGTDPIGASGSQFFIVTSTHVALPDQYALVGKVIGSLAGVRAIARLPTQPAGDGAPFKPVVINSATLLVQ
jgi:cyclophilin family peptidyl-prolyl cis-trans isomerase